jgi:hypothetical protein
LSLFGIIFSTVDTKNICGNFFLKKYKVGAKSQKWIKPPKFQNHNIGRKNISLHAHAHGLGVSISLG